MQLKADEGRLAGRRILVTGSSSGIGKAIAELFYRHGARLALLDLSYDGRWDSTDHVPGSVALRCDVSDWNQVSTAVASASSSLEGLDGVVNVAGIDFIRDFSSMSPEDWRKVLSINLDGPMHVCKAALPALQQHGSGTIVNIASAAGLRPLANRVAYCTSKAGLVMFTKALALELAPFHIRANAVCPGVIDTPMLRASYEDADDPQATLEEIVSRPAMGRLGTVEDIANAALYLTSGDAQYITGTALAVDGGRAFH